MQQGAALDVVSAGWCFRNPSCGKCRVVLQSTEKGWGFLQALFCQVFCEEEEIHTSQNLLQLRDTRPLPVPSPSLSFLTAQVFGNWTVSKFVMVKSYSSSGEHLYLLRQEDTLLRLRLDKWTCAPCYICVFCCRSNTCAVEAALIYSSHITFVLRTQPLYTAYI